MRTKILLISLLALLLIGLTGCGSDTTTADQKTDADSDIIGTWTNDEDNMKTVYTFDTDGVYTSTIEATSETSDEVIQSEATGTYKLDGDSLILTQDSVAAGEGESTEETNNQDTSKYTYTVENDQLTLEDSSGYSMVFTKDM